VISQSNINSSAELLVIVVGAKKSMIQHELCLHQWLVGSCSFHPDSVRAMACRNKPYIHHLVRIPCGPSYNGGRSVHTDLQQLPFAADRYPFNVYFPKPDTSVFFCGLGSFIRYTFGYCGNLQLKCMFSSHSNIRECMITRILEVMDNRTSRAGED